MQNVIKKNRFVISQNLVKNNVNIEFTNKKGETYHYNAKLVFEQLKDKFENMNCYIKYKTYTNTNNLPTFVRSLENGVELVS